MPVERVIAAVLGLAALGVAVTVAARNWIGLVRGLRGTESSSPILLMGPLFAFLAGGALARGFPGWPPATVWLPGVAIVVLDPAALPLVLWMLLRRRRPPRPEAGTGED